MSQQPTPKKKRRKKSDEYENENGTGLTVGLSRFDLFSGREDWYYNRHSQSANRQVFLNALENGLGLSRSAVLAGFTPQTVSEELEKDPEFTMYAQEALLIASQLMLIVSNKSRKNKDFDTFKLNQQALERMIVQLNLWQCYSERDYLTKNKVVNAIVLYRYPEEIATALGLTLDEYTTYMLQHDYLFKQVEQTIGITGLK